MIQSVGGSWAAHSPAQLKTTLVLVKGDVGLGNVDNTADTAKPISTATQTALDAKAPIRRTLNAQTGTTYTPVVGDENLMVTLSNASAITVTLPAELGGRRSRSAPRSTSSGWASANRRSPPDPAPPSTAPPA